MEGENVRNQVISVLSLLQATEGHLGARDVLLGVLEVLEERLVVPGDALLLVGIGVGVALDGAGLAAEEAVQGRADLVAAGGVDGVALSAARLEEVGTLLNITWVAYQSSAAAGCTRVRSEMLGWPLREVECRRMM